MSRPAARLALARTVAPGRPDASEGAWEIVYNGRLAAVSPPAGLTLSPGGTISGTQAAAGTSGFRAGLAPSAAGTSGTPAVPGSTTFTVQVTDEASARDSRTLTLVVTEIVELVPQVHPSLPPPVENRCQTPSVALEGDAHGPTRSCVSAHSRRRGGAMQYKTPCRPDSRSAAFALFMVLSPLLSCGGDSDTTEPEPPVATTVVIAPTSQTLTAIGETAQLSAEVRDQNGQMMGGAEVTWDNEAPAVVSVTQAGTVTALSEGSATITASAGSATGTATVTVSQAVSSITVTPAVATIETGETVQLTAQATDANNNTVDGATFTWSSQSSTIASVDESGIVTGNGAGSTTITATSAGVDGIAEITVVLPPIASVEVSGVGRVKVGVTYQYTATARLADGTIVDRPMTWSISPPSKGNMTTDGTLTPLETGVITLRVTIDGTVWTAEITAYDWVSLAGGGSLFLSLDADVEITNKFGTSEFPELVFACNQDTGNFFAWVDTESFVTASGLVAFIFGDGEAISQTWIEFDDFSALGHPGPTNLQTKDFALAMAAVSEFYFAFTEFQGSAKATLFRVTGLADLLPALLDACPSNSLATPSEADATVQAYRKLSGRPPPMLDPSVQHQGQLRAEAGPEDAAIPSLTAVHSPDTRTWPMRRR